MNAVVNGIYNLSAGFTHKNGREDTCNARVRYAGEREPAALAERAAPSNGVEFEFCQFDRFAK
jgi:hypothetical protein